ncbi:hypothetical protein LSH36_595g02002 [Paralvinella palmiformis]|uniref:Uncharacterized protein n=1 Tax=Paralvinella palmiformis TaxID=53620 RepID=A0AAD9J547_9ANNE|nr:hypothetical protein LSH36_595g02002 [Paralvinella palmiformis]
MPISSVLELAFHSKDTFVENIRRTDSCVMSFDGCLNKVGRWT